MTDDKMTDDKGTMAGRPKWLKIIAQGLTVNSDGAQYAYTPVLQHSAHQNSRMRTTTRTKPLFYRLGHFLTVLGILHGPT
jgi:hypothetical protein